MVRDGDGLSLLATAVPCINMAAALALLESGAGPQAYDRQGRSAIEVSLVLTYTCSSLHMYSEY